MSNEKPPKGWQQRVCEAIEKEEEALELWDRGQSLTPEQEALVEPHKRMVRRLKELPPIDPLPGFDDRVKARWRAMKRQRRNRLIFAAIAATVVLAILLFIIR